MADLSKIIERVQKLIALSASSNEHEARNAAFLAVKLIREHNLPIGQMRERVIYQDRVIYRDRAAGRPYQPSDFDFFSTPRPPRSAQRTQSRSPPPRSPPRPSPPDDPNKTYVKDVSADELDELFRNR